MDQTSESKSHVGRSHYDANYGNFQTELYEQIRREAFGEDIGQNSWLTANEQDKFLSWLNLFPAKPCSMLPVEPEARRCVSQLPPAVPSSGLTFMNRQFRLHVCLQPNAA
jgi:hypothetical protein